MLAMTKKATSGGRPANLPIQGELVRKRRNELGLGQAALVEKVYAAMGRHRLPDVDSLERQCRRWEAENVISAGALKALADVVGHSAKYLQEGGAPGPAPDRLAEIRERLRKQLQASNPKAQEFVQGIHRLEQLGGLPTLADQEEALYEAARAVEVRLGSAQLTQRADQLADLGAITGWRISDLSKPAGAHGHWLVATEGAAKTTTEIHRGRQAVFMALLREAKEWRTGRSCDSRVTLCEEAPWFRMRLEDPRLPVLDTTISFVRLEPTDTGVRWSPPTEHERWDVCEDLAQHLAREFNFVRDFGDHEPWPDFRRIRLELWDESNAAAGALPVPIARFRGALDRLADHCLASFVREGSAYSVITNWLTSDLDEELVGYLAHWPRGCWKAQAADRAIHIVLETPLCIARQLGRAPAFGRMFRLVLVEETDDGTTRRLAWSDDVVAEAVLRVERAFDALPDSPTADVEFVGPRRPACT
jgi:hypothetical protein